MIHTHKTMQDQDSLISKKVAAAIANAEKSIEI
ncbi:hypothetical protein KCTC52924_00065 [Arenibacter antarcticus]